MALSFATKKLLVLFLVFVATLTLGMLIFVAIEGRDGKWGYGDGLRFAVQVVTTIGYGDCTPVTTAGKIFCIFYAMFGIPVALLFLQAVGERVLNLQHKLLKRGCEVEPPYLNEKCVAMSFVFLVVLVFLGAVTQLEVEGWSFVDGFYFYVITFTTVGFGDLIPGQHDYGIYIIQPFCIILGLVIMSNVLNGLAGCSQSGAALKKLLRCDGQGEETPETDVAMTEQNSAQPTPVDA